MNYHNEQPKTEVPPEPTMSFGYPQQTPIPQQQPASWQQASWPQQQGYGQPMYPQQQTPMPPMQGQYPQQPLMQMPYQQQPMMMPPINVVVNNANNNANTNMNMGGLGYIRVRKQGVPILFSILYFICIGYFIGFCWLIIGLVLSAIGSELGNRMMRQLPMAFFLRQPTQEYQAFDRPW